MQLPNLSNCRQIAAGGEGAIYEHPTDNSKVIKVYHQVRPAAYENHLKQLSTLGNDFTAPIDIYTSNKGTVGFSMSYVDFNDYWLFNNLFNKGFCTSHSIKEDLKIKILNSLSAKLLELHNKKIVVGDLNQYNIFVSKKGDVLFVDVDSYQTPSNPHSGVLLDDIRDWTTNAINEKSDIWSYNILAFWATTFCHPFKWVVPGNTESLEQRVKAGKSILTKITGVKIPPLYVPPVGEVLKQFNELLHTTRRYMVNFTGVHTPINVVIPQQIVSTSVNIREIKKGVITVLANDKFISVLTTDGMWTRLVTDTKGVTRELDVQQADIVFPDGSKFANKKLYDKNGVAVKTAFNKTQWYYHKGFLNITDYTSDVQWNYNLFNQMAGIDCTQTPIFAKSVQFKSAPIQNFGAKKYLNIPHNNSYQLLPLPEGTIDAFYCDGYHIVEYKEKRTVKYTLYKQSTPIVSLDNLAHFAVKGDFLFVPEDGEIHIYHKGMLNSKLDVSMCTQDSKLWCTDSGIMLLENGILYLLNNK